MPRGFGRRFRWWWYPYFWRSWGMYPYMGFRIMPWFGYGAYPYQPYGLVYPYMMPYGAYGMPYWGYGRYW